MEKPESTKQLELPTKVVERIAALNVNDYPYPMRPVIEQCKEAMKPRALPVDIATQLLNHSKTGDQWPFIEEELVILEEIIAYARRRRELEEKRLKKSHNGL
jgi:hypothetical protein